MTMLEQTPPPAELPLLDVKDLAQRYTLPRESMFKPAGQVHALNGVSAQVMAGRSLGVVGESGCRLTSCAAPGVISRWCFRIPMARWIRDRPLRVSSRSP
jgi:ABC-type microcin C transport system duplicated ATPase subunit YejF